MNINDFYINAIRAKAQWDRAWVLRAFTITIEPVVGDITSLKTWHILRTPAGVAFKNQAGNLESISDAKENTPLLTAQTVLTVPAGFFDELPEGIVTTAGNLLFNSCCLWPTVGMKFGYFNGTVDPKDIEKRFAATMVDDPEEGVQKNSSLVYVSDRLRYGQAIRYMEEFTQVFVWSMTMKSIIPNKAVLERKAQLLEENRAQLDNPVVQSKIYKELEDMDAAAFKNDPNFAFTNTAKHRLARRKLTIMYGSEQGLDRSVDPKLVTNSLYDGLKPENMIDVMNVSRAGSFDRGSETMYAGVVAKWGSRVMSASDMAQEDCKTTLGYSYTVTEGDLDNTVGRYLMEGNTLTNVADMAAAKQLLGKRITVRTPSRCAAGPSVKWCKYCLGTQLASNPESLALAVSAYGSGFLNLFLKSANAKATTPVRLDLRKLMS